jgi:flavin-dependent dehydrogenase
MQEELFDIVIIGAGPTGSMAAMRLAGRFRVLLLERYPLPRNKSCSGVLIRKSVDLVEKEVGAIPERVCCTPFTTSGLTVITARRTYDFLDAGINVVRASFDNWLAETARERGATLLDEAVVTNLTPDGCVAFLHKGQRQSVRAKLVVACDGVNGVSRRLLGVAPQNKVVTFQRFYRGSMDADPARFYAYTSPEFSRFDAWFNSKNGLIVAGSIAATRTEAERFQEVFVQHLSATMGLRIDHIEKSEVWTLPLVVPERGVVFQQGNVLFAGEAAGLLNPFGEGMSIGMSSALALSEACLAGGGNLDPPALAKDYAALVGPELAYMRRQWGYLREISPEFWENVTQLSASANACISAG